jgi:hypothetical protein
MEVLVIGYKLEVVWEETEAEEKRLVLITNNL